MRKIDFLKKGRSGSVSLTNTVINGNFVNTGSWVSTGASFSVSSNEAAFLANSYQDDLAQINIALTNAHKYYFCALVKTGSSSISLRLTDNVSYVEVVNHSGSGSYEFLSGIHTAIRSVTGARLYVLDSRASGWNTINAKYVSMIDLTATFGAGLEPNKVQMDNLMLQFSNQWLNGTQTAVYNW